MADKQVDIHRGNVIIVDDTLPNLRLLTQMLTKYGYLVRGIPNGAMALTAAV
jgi:two-component system sensor histidine kinase/response regulator